MNEVMCPCGGKLLIDYERTKSEGTGVMVYYCGNCLNQYVLNLIGTREPGFRTKSKLKESETLRQIKF